jgi:hypothetical protein
VRIACGVASMIGDGGDQPFGLTRSFIIPVSTYAVGVPVYLKKKKKKKKKKKDRYFRTGDFYSTLGEKWIQPV